MRIHNKPQTTKKTRKRFVSRYVSRALVWRSQWQQAPDAAGRMNSVTLGVLKISLY
jgi:hypothetical protein